jgi:hypothetical protein
MQLFSLAWRIHVKEDHRVWAVFLWEHNKGVHRTVGGLNVYMFFNHVIP